METNYSVEKTIGVIDVGVVKNMNKWTSYTLYTELSKIIQDYSPHGLSDWPKGETENDKFYVQPRSWALLPTMSKAVGKKKTGVFQDIFAKRMLHVRWNP